MESTNKYIMPNEGDSLRVIRDDRYTLIVIECRCVPSRDIVIIYLHRRRIFPSKYDLYRSTGGDEPKLDVEAILCSY